MPATIEEQLEAARRKLLDLTMRNHLLNYKQAKARTITNVVAELLAAGKSVLFVSEKMAALKVVKDRLDRGKLGNYCLELHSRKSNKKEVLRELERAIKSAAPRGVSLEDEFDEVESLKAELNEYARSLREPVSRVRRAPFDLIRAVEAARRHFNQTGKEMARVALPGAAYAERQGSVLRRGDFVWRTRAENLRVRRRNGDPPIKVELICDEEIAEALRLVLRYQFATARADLVKRASKLFGFQSLHTQSAARFEDVLQKLLAQGELEERANGLVNFAE